MEISKIVHLTIVHLRLLFLDNKMLARYHYYSLLLNQKAYACLLRNHRSINLFLSTSIWHPIQKIRQDNLWKSMVSSIIKFCLLSEQLCHDFLWSLCGGLIDLYRYDFLFSTNKCMLVVPFSDTKKPYSYNFIWKESGWLYFDSFTNEDIVDFHRICGYFLLSFAVFYHGVCKFSLGTYPCFV